ncbi:MAG: CPBP family intramembrane metalloprotease [Ferruginibacter sp.]|nr:CPBP family intramembrane metalloprotease [Chitinophagaceae bacterium]
MKGVLKGKPAGIQFLILISIALGSFFILGLLGTVLLSNLTGMGIMTMSDSSKWNYTDGRLLTVIRGMQLIQFICLFVVPSFLCAWVFSTDSKKYLGLKKPSRIGYFAAAVVLMILALPLVNFLGELNSNVRFPPGIEKWMKAQEEEAAKSIKVLLSRHTLKDLFLNIIFIAGMAAVGEELLFRGVIQRLLTRLFKSPWAGIIVSAFLFSAMHVQFYGFLPRLMLGILLGLVYWYSGSLWTAILGHFVYDALLIVLVYFYPVMLNDNSPVKLSALAMAGATSLVLVAVLVRWMRKRTTTRYPEVYAEDAIPLKDHPF